MPVRSGGSRRPQAPLVRPGWEPYWGDSMTWSTVTVEFVPYAGVEWPVLVGRGEKQRRPAVLQTRLGEPRDPLPVYLRFARLAEQVDPHPDELPRMDWAERLPEVAQELPDEHPDVAAEWTARNMVAFLGELPERALPAFVDFASRYGFLQWAEAARVGVGPGLPPLDLWEQVGQSRIVGLGHFIRLMQAIAHLEQKVAQATEQAPGKVELLAMWHLWSLSFRAYLLESLPKDWSFEALWLYGPPFVWPHREHGLVVGSVSLLSTMAVRAAWDRAVRGWRFYRCEECGTVSVSDRPAAKYCGPSCAKRRYEREVRQPRLIEERRRRRLAKRENER